MPAQKQRRKGPLGSRRCDNSVGNQQPNCQRSRLWPDPRVVGWAVQQLRKLTANRETSWMPCVSRPYGVAATGVTAGLEPVAPKHAMNTSAPIAGVARSLSTNLMMRRSLDGHFFTSAGSSPG